MNRPGIICFISGMLVVAIGWTNLQLHDWRSPERIIANDVISYYAYLPATFIYHDPTLHFIETAPAPVRGKIWFGTTPDGRRYLKTSLGLSLLWAPFFLAAHATAEALGYDANGYSMPYRFALVTSCVLYVACALYFLTRVLARFFEPWVVALTSIAVTLGTNLFYYATTEPTMSHAYSFFLFAMFLHFALKWHDKHSRTLSVFLGLLTGLIVLVRPANAVIVLFFVLWNVQTLQGLVTRTAFFCRWYKHALIMGACAGLVWVPQMIFWKIGTGQWVFYSYGAERFFWSAPKLVEGLFGYRKGWLLYTPVMLLSIAGIPLLWKQHRALFAPVAAFTLVNVYVILSWWSWWYGGSFGHRAFIDSYPLLALPMACCITWIGGATPARRALAVLSVALLSAFNLFETAQYRNGAIHWDSMSQRAYWSSFGHLHPAPDFETLIEPPDYDKALQGIR